VSLKNFIVEPITRPAPSGSVAVKVASRKYPCSISARKESNFSSQTKPPPVIEIVTFPVCAIPETPLT